MKTLLLAAFLFLAAGLRAATVTAVLSYNFTGSVVCSSTVTTNCLTGFQAGTYIGSAFVSMVNIALPTNPTGTVTGMSGSFPLVGVYGAIPIAAIVNGKDLNGNPISSNPQQAEASVTVLPSAPGISVSAQ